MVFGLWIKCKTVLAHHKKRMKIHLSAIVVLFILILVVLCLWELIQRPKRETHEEYDLWYDISCYRDTDHGFKLVAGHNYTFPHRNIFFLITSCTGRLDYRQACAAESAALRNPRWTVTVFFTGPIARSYWREARLSKLSLIKNLLLVRLDVDEFTAGTPLEPLFRNNVLKKSLYPALHLSDLLKWLILNRHGGVFLSPAVVVVAALDEEAPMNFAGGDWGQRSELALAGTTLLALTKDGIGKTFSDIAIRHLSRHFEPRSWSDSGPDLVLSTLYRICSTRDKHLMTETSCQGFHLLPRLALYPVPWDRWSAYLAPGSDQDVDRLSAMALAHVAWAPPAAPHPRRSDPARAPHSLYAALARTSCPDVYNYYFE